MLTLFRLFLPRIFIKLSIPALIAVVLCVLLGTKAAWPMIVYPTTWVLIIYSQYLSRTLLSRNLNWITLLPETRTKLQAFAVLLNLVSAGLAVFLATLLHLATYTCVGGELRTLAGGKALSLFEFLLRPDLVLGVYIYYVFLYTVIFWPTNTHSAKDGVVRIAKYFFGFVIFFILLAKIGAPFYLGSGYFALAVLFLLPLLLVSSSAKFWQVHAKIRKNWLARSAWISSAVAGVLIVYSVWCIFASTDSHRYWALKTWRIEGIVLTSEKMKEILKSDLDVSAWRDATSFNDKRYGFSNRPVLNEILSKSDSETLRFIANHYSYRKVSIDELTAYSKARERLESDRSNLFEAVKWARSDFRDQDIITLTQSPDDFLRLVGFSHILIFQKYAHLGEALRFWRQGVFQEIDPIVNNLREFNQSITSAENFQINESICAKIVRPKIQITLENSTWKISYCLKFMANKALLIGPGKYFKDAHFGRIENDRFGDWVKAQSVTPTEIAQLPHAKTEDSPSTKVWVYTLRAIVPDPLTQPTISPSLGKHDYRRIRRDECSWRDRFSVNGVFSSVLLAASPLLTPAYPLALVGYQDNFGSIDRDTVVY